MNFTKNKSFGFKNFDDCFNYWSEQAESDPTVSVEHIFHLSEADLFTGRPYHQSPKQHREHNIRHRADYFLSHLLEIEMYEDLEDEYMCSGMCKNSLFYFGLNLEEGIPKITCLQDLKDFMDGSA